MNNTSSGPIDPDNLDLSSESPRNVNENSSNRKRLNSLIDIEKNQLESSLNEKNQNKVDSSSDKSHETKVKVKNKVSLSFKPFRTYGILREVFINPNC